MAGKVFTETMDRLDPTSPERAIATLDAYIRYMIERIDFSVRGVFNAASAAGNSNAEVAAEVEALRNDLSAARSVISSLQGGLTAAQDAIISIQADIGSASTAGTIMYELSQLDQRVSALERQNNTPNTPTP